MERYSLNYEEEEEERVREGKGSNPERKKRVENPT